MGSAALVVACAIGAAGCGTSSDGAAASPSTPPPSQRGPSDTTVSSAGEDYDDLVEGVSGELVITRQRDLLDRGLINVLTTNSTGQSLRVTDRRLVAEHFETPAAAPRISMLPDGRNVALQVPYGTVTDCAADTPVEAQLHMTLTIDGSVEEHDVAVDLQGSELLDTIRDKQCAGQTFTESTAVRFEDVVIDGESVVADLVIANTDRVSTFVVERTFGTILVGVETAVDVLPVQVSAGDSKSIPVDFVVIRCDPHALAEVTKRYGLDLSVSRDGQPAQPIAIDVSPLTSELELIVERCRQQQH